MTQDTSSGVTLQSPFSRKELKETISFTHEFMHEHEHRQCASFTCTVPDNQVVSRWLFLLLESSVTPAPQDTGLRMTQDWCVIANLHCHPCPSHGKHCRGRSQAWLHRQKGPQEPVTAMSTRSCFCPPLALCKPVVQVLPGLQWVLGEPRILYHSGPGPMCHRHSLSFPPFCSL